MDLVLFYFCLSFRAVPTAYGGSQARGRIGAAATGLHHSHSSARSEMHLQPIPQVTATLDPEPTERGQGLWMLVRFVSAEPRWEFPDSWILYLLMSPSKMFIFAWLPPFC